MGLFDQVKEAFGGNFIKGEEFENGLTLTIKSEPVFVQVSDPKYGFKEGHPKEGMTVRYSFVDGNGVDRTFETTSVRFKQAVENSGVNIGGTVKITRSGSGMNTSYEAELI
jgi:hypothetical protein